MLGSCPLTSCKWEYSWYDVGLICIRDVACKIACTKIEFDNFVLINKGLAFSFNRLINGHVHRDVQLLFQLTNNNHQMHYPCEFLNCIIWAGSLANVIFLFDNTKTCDQHVDASINSIKYPNGPLEVIIRPHISP